MLWAPQQRVVKVCTMQASVGAGKLLELPWEEGLASVEEHQLQDLLQQWSGVFAAHEVDFGCTNAILHYIPTRTTPLNCERYRSVPHSLYPGLQSLLKGMLNSGLITNSSSPLDTTLC
ncbi:hypothetical protein AAFF_G00411440 [Aldrovandia affinis]|uniref:Uncharacterized protein n=1 Tax=Aldrovandia affinis TaxID=143900 RepID=A0AAD7WJP2_9TELE|nr:hypothetical protein AAFF_G00411440 [Aldrovandia affinis]